MPAPLMVGMTPDIKVVGPYTIRLTALDASTGNTVSGVKVSSGYIIAIDDSPPNSGDLNSPPALLVPTV